MVQTRSMAKKREREDANANEALGSGPLSIPGEPSTAMSGDGAPPTKKNKHGSDDMTEDEQVDGPGTSGRPVPNQASTDSTELQHGGSPRSSMNADPAGEQISPSVIDAMYVDVHEDEGELEQDADPSSPSLVHLCPYPEK